MPSWWDWQGGLDLYQGGASHLHWRVTVCAAGCRGAYQELRTERETGSLGEYREAVSLREFAGKVSGTERFYQTQERYTEGGQPLWRTSAGAGGGGRL